MFFWDTNQQELSESDYSHEYNLTNRKSIQIAATFGLLVYNLYLILDFIEVPESFFEILLIRSAIVTPIVLGAIAALSDKKLVQLTRIVTLGCSILVGLSTIYFTYLRNPAMEARDPIGMVFTSLYLLTALRMRRREALIYSVVVLASTTTLLKITDASPDAWFSFLSAILVTCSLGLGVAHIMENSWKENFLQKRTIAQKEAQAASLLEMIFPRSIADRLKEQKDSIAEYAAQVSVLFADIEGFTAITAKISPRKLVDDLDTIFSKLDSLCQLHGCEKIKTVGDAYLAVSGIPLPSTDHAQRIVRLAIAMQKESDNMTIGGHPVKFRIGIHSGPVVAGVIGKSRFAYDLWGDTVNTASRMESSAPSNSIQISADTAKLVKDQFAMTCRGAIKIKGKDSAVVWLVDRENWNHHAEIEPLIRKEKAA